LDPNHVSIVLGVPSNYAVPQVFGYMKGEKAIPLAQAKEARNRNFVDPGFELGATSYSGWVATRRLFERTRAAG
jgi:REP element-mobilizing transposase RayT